ncbi:MAG: glycerate kinase [Prolixibacteraceae bacterium]
MATKIIIAPDKFKGSLSGIDFCNIVERVLKAVVPDVNIKKLPLADGGDGTLDVLHYYLGGMLMVCTVQNPLNIPIEATYLFSENKKMAFIEMAQASGIKLLSHEQLNPLKTSTYGTGQLILDAIKRGAKQIILGIGGSSSNDAGMGMARALGYQFYDDKNQELAGKGEDLQKLHRIDRSNVLSQLKDISFEVACDVDNPLFGTNGAAFIYAQQKGADAKMVQELDKGLQNFNRLIKTQFGTDLQQIKGAGAAGGLGAGSICFLNAKLKPGIGLIKEIANFDLNIQDADWIITGEGKFDEQTFSGKVIKGIIESIKNQQLAVLCGISELSDHQLKKHNIHYIDQMINYASDIHDSINNSGKYLEAATLKFAKSELNVI